MKTYISKGKKFKLNPKNILIVVGELNDYVQKHRENEDSALFKGADTLEVLVKAVYSEYNVVIPFKLVMPFKLAKLTIIENGKNLNLQVYKHPKLLVNPKKIYEIGEKYKVKK